MSVKDIMINSPHHPQPLSDPMYEYQYNQVIFPDHPQNGSPETRPDIRVIGHGETKSTLHDFCVTNAEDLVVSCVHDKVRTLFDGCSVLDKT